jgi:protease-4
MRAAYLDVKSPATFGPAIVPPMIPRPARILVLVSFSLCSLLRSGALAQTSPLPRGEPASQGVANPSVGVASDPDASSIERNPAMLGYLRSWSGVYLHSELDANGVVGGRGDGFFFASPLPYVSSIILGGAVQLVRPPDTFPYGNLAKISLSLAWRLHPLISFGLHYAHLAASESPVAGGVDTLDLALGGRLGRFLGWGLVVRDVPSSAVGGVPLQRVYDPEIAIRPFGTDLIELSAGARFGERRGDIDPHFRLWAVAHSGVRVKADVEWRRDLDLDGHSENDVRVALGLQLDLERVGVAGFGLFGRDEGRTQGHGFSLVARLSGERYPALWRGPRYLERVELNHDLRGRRLLELLDRLRALEHDDATLGVVVLGGELGAGWAAAEELRAALLRLRRAKKHVFSFLLHADTKGYLVASAAERVLFDPAGDLILTGASLTLPYFKGTGELFGLQADYVRIGAYKSAPERYTMAAPSPESRASRETYYDDLYRHLSEAIGAARGMSTAEARRRIDGGPYSPTAAREAGLVDEVRPGEELGAWLERQLGRAVAVRDGPRAPARASSWATPRVAVVHIEGDLVNGPSRDIPVLGLHATGLADIMSALEHALDDSRVRAIVLRIDSPGGSALAADLLAREITRARAHKPVLCSLGDLAASGGYYLAAACEQIFAAPSTLTGSIGIYTGKIDFSGLLGKLGVTLTRIERGARAGIDSPFRKYTDEERAALTRILHYHYRRFVDAVARGRTMSEARVEQLGEGRIYSGDRALNLGLVDQYGGLQEAVEAAARRAGITASSPIDLTPSEPTVLGQIGRLLGLKLPGVKTKASLPAIEDLLELLPGSLVFEPSVPQARLEIE